MSTTKGLDTEYYKPWSGADKASFEEHATKVHSLSTKPGNDDLLKLYGLFKQVTVGDNDTARPSAFAFAEKYKWDAWHGNKGLSQDEAAKQYIEVVKGLIEKYGK